MFRRISTKGSKRRERRRKISNATSDEEVVFQSVFPFSKRRPALVANSLQCEHFTFHVFILLETFLGVCYFLLLVPFRIGKNSQGFYVKSKNFVQQIFSSLFITLVAIYSVVDLRLFLEQDLRENPENAFRYATGFIIHLIPICWAMTFWLRAESFNEILTVGQYPAHLQHQQQPLLITETTTMSSKRPNWKLIWFLKITILTNFARFIVRFYVFNDGGSMEFYLNYVTGNALYNAYIKDDKFAEIETGVRLNSTVLASLSYPLALIDVMFELTLLMFEQFCLTGAVMVYAACGNFSEELDRSRDNLNTNYSVVQLQRIIKVISLSYLDLVLSVETINKFFGPSILLFFMYLYPLFIWCIFDRTEDGCIWETMIIVYDMAILVSVTAIAAAGNAKVGKLKKWLFQICMSDCDCTSTHQSFLGAESPERKSQSSEVEPDEPNLAFYQNRINDARFLLTSMHREVSSEVIGLQGCNFFTITYNFIGTMIGIVITYAIVMLQFIMKPKENVGLCDFINNENSTLGNFSAEPSSI